MVEVAKAIADGRLAFPALDLQVGAADRLPFALQAVDVVIFGFCLYPVEPDLHLAAVARANRVLREGGVLIIMYRGISKALRRLASGSASMSSSSRWQVAGAKAETSSNDRLS